MPCGETPESSFLFIPDLTDKATGWVLIVLIVLYVGSQLVSTLLMSATADKNQRMIFLALPFLFVAFIWQFPAGLLVYWITTNLWTILQQSIIKKRLGPLREEAMAAAKAAKEQAELEESKGKGKGKGGKDGKDDKRRRPRARQALPHRRGGLGRRRRLQVARRQRPSAGTAAQEEEALGAPPVSDAPASAADRVRDLLERVNDALALEAEVEIEQDDEGVIRATLHAEDLGLFIGRHGTTIDAVQHLAYRAAAAADDGPQRVIVDAAGYRERRATALHRQADEAAEDALRTGRPVALDAMSATERKVVHEHLKDREDVETYSEGTEPDRHLVVAPLAERTVSRFSSPRRRETAARRPGRGPRRSGGADVGPRPQAGAQRPHRGLAERARGPRASVRRGGSRTSAPARACRGSCSRSRCRTREVVLVESVGKKCAWMERDGRAPGARERCGSRARAWRSWRRRRSTW